MTVYSYIFGVIIACASYFFYQKYVNIYTSIVLKPEKRYDYIIVGAGTSGCVLATRLSEDPKIKVLLVEAGDNMGFLTNIPLTSTAAQLGPNDWSVRTVPQKYSSFGMWKQTHIIPRGKGLGGSGQLNFLLHGFGLPQDYERWSELGFNGWSIEDLKPYFIKAFGTDRHDFDSGHCSVNGDCPGNKAPMKLKLVNEDDELMNTFRKASEQLKNKYSVFRKASATVHNGVRLGTLDAYLKPAIKRRNLHILLKTQAISIRFVNKKASSLYILQNHRELNNIFVNKEIILSAGVFKTPQILMLSGIGPRDLLQRFRIKLVAENNHVGKNFHDPMNLPIYVSIKKPISVTLSKVFSFSTVWDYLFKSEGLLAFPPVAGVEYQNRTSVMLFSMGTASERLLRDLSNYKPFTFRSTFPFYNSSHKEGFMFLTTCTQPVTRGYVALASAEVKVQPVVDPRYLENYGDIKCMIQAIRRVEQLVSSKPFQDIGAKIHWPRPERCLSFWNYTLTEQMDIPPKRKRFSKSKMPNPPKQNKPKKPERPPDAYLECVIREVAVTGHHASGTCSAGKVVDSELRVKSVSGVRIVDSSVFPSPLSSYPNSVLIAMAEKAADMILSSRTI